MSVIIVTIPKSSIGTRSLITFLALCLWKYVCQSEYVCVCLLERFYVCLCNTFKLLHQHYSAYATGISSHSYTHKKTHTQIETDIEYHSTQLPQYLYILVFSFVCVRACVPHIPLVLYTDRCILISWHNILIPLLIPGIINCTSSFYAIITTATTTIIKTATTNIIEYQQHQKITSTSTKQHFILVVINYILILRYTEKKIVYNQRAKQVYNFLK